MGKGNRVIRLFYEVAGKCSRGLWQVFVGSAIKESFGYCGSLVTKSFLPYSIVGGSPAHVLKARLSEQEIELHEQMLGEG